MVKEVGRDLSEAEKQVEAFIEVLSKRYGIEEEEIPKLLSSVRWAAERRDIEGKISFITVAMLITTILGAGLLVIWEGFKVFVGRSN